MGSSSRAGAILRLLGLSLLAWLVLPLTVCAWVLYGCWRLLAAVGQLVRPGAAGLRPAAAGSGRPGSRRRGHRRALPG